MAASLRDEGRRDLSRLRWRCRRGMRELDTLLTRYLERHYPAAPSSERDAFARLLELPDPDVFGYLVGRVEPAAGPLRDVVASIRNAAY
jgi:antitoxin CptB